MWFTLCQLYINKTLPTQKDTKGLEMAQGLRAPDFAEVQIPAFTKWLITIYNSRSWGFDTFF